MSVEPAQVLDEELPEEAWAQFDLDADMPLLEAALRATPSAHNTQPFRVRPVGPGQYDLYHSDKEADVPEPRGLVSYLNSGALVKAFELTAPNFGKGSEFTRVLKSTERGLFIGRIVLTELVEGAPVDPLSEHVAGRHTNRGKYHKTKRLPLDLVAQLEQRGNVLVPPQSSSMIWSKRAVKLGLTQSLSET